MTEKHTCDIHKFPRHNSSPARFLLRRMKSPESLDDRFRAFCRSSYVERLDVSTGLKDLSHASIAYSQLLEHPSSWARFQYGGDLECIFILSHPCLTASRLSDTFHALAVPERSKTALLPMFILVGIRMSQIIHAPNIADNPLSFLRSFRH